VKPTALTFGLVEYLKRTGRWESILELTKEMGVTERTVRTHVRFLERQGILERYALLHEHLYRFHSLTPEFAPLFELWCETRGVAQA
jgi:DNA-binding Lrp family transcriptional regulator